MKKYVNVFCITLLLLCAVMQPCEASAYVVGQYDYFGATITHDVSGNKHTFYSELFPDGQYEVETDETRPYLYIYLYSGMFCVVRAKSASCTIGSMENILPRMKFVDEYGSALYGREFYSKINVWGYVDFASSGAWKCETAQQVTDKFRECILYSNVDLYWSFQGEKYLIRGAVNAPTSTPTPTPVPVVNIDVSDTGLKETFGFVMDIFNVPFVIAGIEVTFLQIFMYTVLASLVIYLVFSPSKD